MFIKQNEKRKKETKMIHIVKRGETLTSIAKDYRVSFSQLLAANPEIRNANIIMVGQSIRIPGLPNPDTIPYHLVVSRNKRILQVFRQNNLVKTYPIAVGKMLSATPAGQFVIVNREPNPGGPYGAMWLSLSKAGYGIHGTNDPSSIGKAVSKGCIRMHNQDVLELARQVPNGTKVMIQP
jgi:L,D-transpeptidase ErfK/SrfK